MKKWHLFHSLNDPPKRGFDEHLQIKRIVHVASVPLWREPAYICARSPARHIFLPLGLWLRASRARRACPASTRCCRAAAATKHLYTIAFGWLLDTPERTPTSASTQIRMFDALNKCLYTECIHITLKVVAVPVFEALPYVFILTASSN